MGPFGVRVVTTLEKELVLVKNRSNIALDCAMKIIRRIAGLRILRNRSRESEVYAITGRNEL